MAIFANPKLLIAAAIALLTLGCAKKHELGTAFGSDSGTDSASPVVVRCGAQDVAPGGGTCTDLEGYAWTGSGCAYIGCDCVGPDCDSLFANPQECLVAYEGCRLPCASREVKASISLHCDNRDKPWFWNGLSCIRAELACVTEHFASEAECTQAYSACLARPCTEDDAAGQGDCRGSVGFRWNGFTCEELYGCDCVGADCGAYADLDDCQQAHGACWYDDRCIGQAAFLLRGNFDSSERCADDDSHKYDGRGCQPLCRFQCGGSGCHSIYESKQTCDDWTDPCPNCPLAWDARWANSANPPDLFACDAIELNVVDTSAAAALRASGFICDGLDCRIERSGVTHGAYRVCNAIAANMTIENPAICKKEKP